MSSIPEGQYITTIVYNAYPLSRGSVHITGTSMSDILDFNTGFLSDADDIDLQTQIWAYKKAREIIRRAGCEGELALKHPKFPASSRAALLPLDASKKKYGGLTGENSNIEYTDEDDQAIIKYIRENLGTTWHSLGTSKMACLDNGGVVDQTLSVYGVTGLKCADLSIAPANVGANTCHTAMVIAEKAAAIISAELGLML